MNAPTLQTDYVTGPFTNAEGLVVYVVTCPNCRRSSGHLATGVMSRMARDDWSSWCSRCANAKASATLQSDDLLLDGEYLVGGESDLDIDIDPDRLKAAVMEIISAQIDDLENESKSRKGHS